MSLPELNEAKFAEINDDVIELAEQAFRGLGEMRINNIKQLIQASKVQAVAKAAMAQHRLGRHTLAQEVMEGYANER